MVVFVLILLLQIKLMESVEPTKSKINSELEKQLNDEPKGMFPVLIRFKSIEGFAEVRKQFDEELKNKTFETEGEQFRARLNLLQNAVRNDSKLVLEFLDQRKPITPEILVINPVVNDDCDCLGVWDLPSVLIKEIALRFPEVSEILKMK